MRRSLMHIVALMLCLVVFSPACALADEAQDDDLLVLELSFPETIELSRTGVLALPASCTPSAITVGIDCGMVDMCGIDPCLCGAVDAYGSCACNGTQEVEVAYTVTFADEGVVRLVEFRGTTYLVAVGSGDVEATITASLVHYEDAVVAFTVHVAGWTALDVAKLVGAVVAALVLLGVVVGLALGLARGGRMLARRCRRARGSTEGPEAGDVS